MTTIQFSGVAICSMVGALFAIGLAGCHKNQVDISRPPSTVENDIRMHYAKKYPAFAELVALSNNKNASVESITRGGKLRQMCPVREIKHSSPRGSFCTFVERTDESKTQVRKGEPFPPDGCRPQQHPFAVDVEIILEVDGRPVGVAVYRDLA